MSGRVPRLLAQLGAGWRQARIELVSQLRGGMFLSYLILPLVALGFVLFGNSGGLGGTGLSIATYVVPSLLAVSLVIGGALGPAAELMAEREDGSLARMKVVPGGLQGYVFGKVLVLLITNLATVVLTFLVAAIWLPELLPGTGAAWLRLVVFVVLGLLATAPLGIALGSVVRGATQLVVPTLLIYALATVSGTFFPIVDSPAPLQWAVMVFPVYWLALGLRSAFLPTEALALEIGNSWHTLEAVAVLGLWAALGLVLAPILLRRMARGVSGSTVAQARERMLSRGY